MEEKARADEYFSEEDFELEDTGSFKAKLEGFLESRYFFASVLLLTALASFFLGKLSGRFSYKEPVRVYNAGSLSPNPSASSQFQQDSASIIGPEKNPSSTEVVVASKNGTKYHYPWCAGAKQISEKNKITFNSIEEAKASGYAPAVNCKGLR